MGDVGDTAAEGAPYGEDGRHLPGTPGYRRLNVAMVAAAIAAFGILYAAQPLLPLIAREYDVTPSAASLTVSGATGALAIGVLPLAALAGRWGRVGAMRASLVVATVLTALAALAPTFEVLVGLRMAGGLALAVVTAVAMGHVGSQVAPAGLGAAMGLYVAGNSVGGVTGRVLGSAVADGGSWRWAVLAVAVLAAVATAVFWRVLPAPVAVADGPRSEGRWTTLLRDPAVLGLAVLPFVLMGGFVAVYNYLSFRLVAPPFTLPAALVGLVFLAYLAGTVASAVAGRVADATSRSVVLLTGLAISGAGLALMLVDSLPWVVAGLLVFTTGFFVAHAVASGWMQSSARRLDARSGDRAGAVYVTAYYAGSGIFGALVGLAWESSGWPGVTAAVAALLVVGALAAAVPVTVDRRRRG